MLEIDFSILLALSAIIGLIVGSFLNVAIYRLPQMFFQAQTTQSFNLFLPRSHCPDCKHPLRIRDNIPVFSFLFLRGRCAHCQTHIPKQYLMVELLSAAIAVWLFWQFGLSLNLFIALFLFWALLTLSFIDFNHQILPDVITLPLLWAGLLVNSFSLFTTPESAIIGAISGYLVLWVIYWIFKFLTHKEGIGYGDFKLLAALGAWCGWQALPMIIFLSSTAGSVIGILLMAFAGRSRNLPIAYGPWLAIAGAIVFLWGDEISQIWFNLVGIPYSALFNE